MGECMKKMDEKIESSCSVMSASPPSSPSSYTSAPKSPSSHYFPPTVAFLYAAAVTERVSWV